MNIQNGHIQLLCVSVSYKIFPVTTQKHFNIFSNYLPFRSLQYLHQGMNKKILFLQSFLRFQISTATNLIKKSFMKHYTNHNTKK
jgi:hypothetical protein